MDGQCTELALTDGPIVLRALYGAAAKWIFAITLLLSGITSVVTVTLGGQATWEGFSGMKVRHVISPGRGKIPTYVQLSCHRETCISCLVMEQHVTLCKLCLVAGTVRSVHLDEMP